MSSHVLPLKEGGGQFLGEFTLRDKGFEPPSQSSSLMREEPSVPAVWQAEP